MEFAARQHGVVSRSQLLGAGVPPDLVDHRLRTGRMRRLHRGVYRVGPLIADRAAEMAAVLACGADSAVSHRSASVLWHLLVRPLRTEPVEVIVSRRRIRSRPGIRVRHVHSVEPEEITVLDGIRITTAARTLLDMAAAGGRRELERALAEALARRLVLSTQLVELATRHAGHAGACKLRLLVEGDAPAAFTRSEAEERLLALVRRARLPDPQVNVAVEGFEVDFLWRSKRLVVEVDGRAFHASDRRFENDRRRDALLVAAGYRVMRVTWRQIVREPEALLVRVAGALARPV